MTQHILEPGAVIEIQAGEHRLVIARGGRGVGIGVCDERGAWLPPPVDDPNRVTFAVDEARPEWTDGGAGADAARGLDDADQIPDRDPREAMRFLYEASQRHALLPTLLLAATFDPSASIRKIAAAIGRGRSYTAELVDGIRKTHPTIWAALAGRKQSVKAQQARRRRERGCHVPD